MARKEKVQIDISFITDESKQYAKLIKDTDGLVRELKKAQKEGKDTAGIMRKIAKSSEAAAKIDLSKLTPQQVITRARTLNRLMKNIPQSSPEYRKMSSEVKRLNNHMATTRKRLRGMATDTTKTGSRMSKVFGGLGKLVGGFAIFSAVKGAFTGAMRLGKEALSLMDTGLKKDAQLKAVLKSTNEAAGRSFDQLKQQQKDLSASSGNSLFAEADVAGAQNLLLTFQNIQGEVFDKTMPAILDLSVALGQDLKSSSIQLGKALDDPIKGVTALSRVGVSFSESQKDMIKSLVETGHAAEAQTLILDTLNQQVKGSAKAAAEAGLGPYQVLKLRLDEVKQSVGGLIGKGLKVLQPVMRTVVSFLEKFVGVLTSGKKATGKLSTAVNITVGVFRFLARVISLSITYVKNVASRYASLASTIYKVSKGSSLLGRVLSFLFKPFIILYDIIMDSSAATAGFQSAFKQMGKNIKEEMTQLILSGSIFAKKFKQFFTLDRSKRSVLQGEIDALERDKKKLAETSVSVWSAYTTERDKVLAENKPSRDNSRIVSPAKQPPGLSQQVESGSSSKISSTQAEKKSSAPTLQDRLDLALKSIKAAHDKELLLLRFSLAQKEITQAEYDAKLVDAKKSYYQKQIDTAITFGQSEAAVVLESKVAIAELELELEKQKAEAKKATEAQKLQDIRDSAALEQEDLQRLFEQALFSESEFELAKAEALIATKQAELDIIADFEGKKSDLYLDKQQELTDAEAAQAKTRQEIAQAEADVKQNIKDAQVKASGDLLNATLGFLKRDEAARKKNAGILKAFAAGQIFINTQLEISKIWATQGINPLVAGLRTAAALLRGVTAISKVQAQKLAKGGFPKTGFSGWTGPGAGSPDETGEQPSILTLLHGDEWVAPRWMGVHPKTAPVISWLEHQRVNKMAEGGPVNFDIPELAQNTAQFDQLNATVASLASVVASFPRETRSTVVLSDLQEIQADYDETLADASY